MENRKYIYDEMISKIEKCLNLYNEYKQKDNIYQLFLANGDVIKYSIHKNNIAHLMGVDLNKLVSHKIMEKEESYDMLKKLVEKSYKYWNDMKNTMNFEEIFSTYVNRKLDNFEMQLLVPFPNQIDFVCKYDRERNYASKQLDGMHAEYYIARSNDVGDIVLLGLAKYDNNIYVPQTTRVILNDQDFTKNMSELFRNQVITYLNGLNISNLVTQYSRTVNLNTLEILKALQSVDNICDITDGIGSTLADHMYNVKTLSKNKSASYDSKGVLAKVSEMMSNKEVIELLDDEKVLLDVVTIRLIDTYNDTIFNSDLLDSASSEKYSNMQNERDIFKQKNEELIKELKEEKEKFLSLQEQLSMKDDEIEQLNKIKDSYDNLNQKVKTFINSINS